MIFLFRNGSVREKLRLIFKATRQHARNLALFALIYKGTLLALQAARQSQHQIPHRQQQRSPDPFVAGLLGGYVVFGRHKSSVSQQIVVYVFARVVLGLAALAVHAPGDNALVGARYGGRGGKGFLGDALGLSEEGREALTRYSWPVFASLSWAGVMWLHEWYPSMLQSSLESSMVYMLVSSFPLSLYPLECSWRWFR